MTLALGNADFGPQEHLLGHTPVDEAVQTDAQHLGLTMGQLIQRRQTLPRALPAGSRAAELQITGWQTHAAHARQPLDVLSATLGHQFRGAHQHHRTTRALAQRCRQKGPLALGQLVHRAAPSRFGRFNQFSPLGQGAIRAEKSFVHECSPSILHFPRMSAPSPTCNGTQASAQHASTINCVPFNGTR